jgi:hypothetical protein
LDHWGPEGDQYPWSAGVTEALLGVEWLQSENQTPLISTPLNFYVQKILLDTLFQSDYESVNSSKTFLERIIDMNTNYILWYAIKFNEANINYSFLKLE